MAIVIENSTQAATGSSDPVTFNHTGTGSNLVAVVVISHRYGAEGITSVTYGGNAMTRAVGAFSNVGAYIYYYVNAPSGTQSVNVDFVPGSAGRSNAVTAHTLTGVNLTNPIETTGSAGKASGTSIGVTVVTTVDGCLLFDAMAGTSTGAPTITGGQTSVRSGTWTSGSLGQSYESKVTAGIEEMSWSFTTGESQLAIAAFRPDTIGHSLWPVTA